MPTAATRPCTRTTAAGAIGTELAGWMQAAARERGSSVVGMPVPEGSPGDRLLEALGYRVRWTSWVLELPEGATIPDRELPAGYTVREARPDEYEACWTVVEDAFLEWSVRERQSFEDFSASVVQRPGFEPWNLRVVVDPAGDVVGVAQIHHNVDYGYVDRLATRKDQRGRGLAQASWSTRSASPVSTGARARSSPPTPAPARSASTRRSACAPPRSGSTAPSTCERPLTRQKIF